MTESRSRYLRRTLAPTLVSLVIVGCVGIPAAAASVSDPSPAAGSGTSSSQGLRGWTPVPRAAAATSTVVEVRTDALPQVAVADRERVVGAEDDVTRSDADAPPAWLWVAIAAAVTLFPIVVAPIIRRVMHGRRPQKTDPTSMEWLNKKHGHETAHDANE